MLSKIITGLPVTGDFSPGRLNPPLWLSHIYYMKRNANCQTTDFADYSDEFFFLISGNLCNLWFPYPLARAYQSGSLASFSLASCVIISNAG